MTVTGWRVVVAQHGTTNTVLKRMGFWTMSSSCAKRVPRHYYY